MSKLDDIKDMADLIEKARALGPMTDAERREQAASFAFGNLALTSQWADKPADELAKLRELCRKAAGCEEAEIASDLMSPGAPLDVHTLKRVAETTNKLETFDGGVGGVLIRRSTLLGQLRRAITVEEDKQPLDPFPKNMPLNDPRFGTEEHMLARWRGAGFREDVFFIERSVGADAVYVCDGKRERVASCLSGSVGNAVMDALINYAEKMQRIRVGVPEKAATETGKDLYYESGDLYDEAAQPLQVILSEVGNLGKIMDRIGLVDSDARDCRRSIEKAVERLAGTLRRAVVAETAQTTRRAAVSLVEASDGRVLCVWNRRYDGWSLPGGLVEEGETPEQAQARELEEETGLVTKSADPVFTGEHGIKAKEGAARPGRASFVHVFRVLSVKEGVPRMTEKGCPVTWLTREEFLERSPFREFYERVFTEVPARLISEGVVQGFIGAHCEHLMECGRRCTEPADHLDERPADGRRWRGHGHDGRCRLSTEDAVSGEIHRIHGHNEEAAPGSPDGSYTPHSQLVSKHNAMGSLLGERVVNGGPGTRPYPEWRDRYAWLLRSSLSALDAIPEDGGT